MRLLFAILLILIVPTIIYGIGNDQEEQEIETDREMRKPPKHQVKVK